MRDDAEEESEQEQVRAEREEQLNEVLLRLETLFCVGIQFKSGTETSTFGTPFFV